MIDPYLDFGLTDRTVALTGGASGLGACSAEVLAAAGANVVIGDIGADGAEQLAERLRSEGMAVLAQRCDVTQKSDVEQLVSRAVSEYGRLDVMVNNAGIRGTADLVVDVTKRDLDALIDVNLKGVFYGCQAAMRVMVPQRSGSIINVSSSIIDLPNPNVSVYAMTKAAVAMLTMDLAIEGGPHGIRVNCLAPGNVLTNFGMGASVRNAAGEIQQDVLDTYLATRTAVSPLGIVGEPLDQAHLVHYLASDASKFVTGAILRANGGMGIVW